MGIEKACKRNANNWGVLLNKPPWTNFVWKRLLLKRFQWDVSQILLDRLKCKENWFLKNLLCRKSQHFSLGGKERSSIETPTEVKACLLSFSTLNFFPFVYSPILLCILIILSIAPAHNFFLRCLWLSLQAETLHCLQLYWTLCRTYFLERFP